MRREKGKFFVTIVKDTGNLTKSDEAWKRRQEKIKSRAFASRTDAAMRAGTTRSRNVPA